jgi:hypothetical protein
MAKDNVLVIVTEGQPPKNYSTAHECSSGSPITITAPEAGCSIQFNCAVDSTDPVITPSGNAVYSLTGGQAVKFYLGVRPVSGHRDVQFYVGPAGVTSIQQIIPDPGLNPQAHTVRIGSSGPL